MNKTRLLLSLLPLAASCDASLSPALQAEPMETVLATGSALRFSGGTLDMAIVADGARERTFWIGSCILPVSLFVTEKRSGGRLGLHDGVLETYSETRRRVDAPEPCARQRRPVYTESQLHFASLADAEEWVRMQHWFPWKMRSGEGVAYAGGGVVVFWLQDPEYDASAFELTLLCVQGRPAELAPALIPRPQGVSAAIVGAAPHACQPVSDVVVKETMRWLRVDWEDRQEFVRQALKHRPVSAVSPTARSTR